MASNVVVIHNARQYKIACTPAKPLYEVLTEACARAGIAAEEVDGWALRAAGKTNQLDLSLIYRLAHLSPGAKLDLVRAGGGGRTGAGGAGGTARNTAGGGSTSNAADAQVNVALDVVGSGGNGPGRRTARFPATSSILDILQSFQSTHGDLQLLDRVYHGKRKGFGKGPLLREQTVVLLLNRELADDAALRATTLASLGVRGGSVAIKVSFRQTDVPASASDRASQAPTQTSPHRTVSQAQPQAQHGAGLQPMLSASSDTPMPDNPVAAPLVRDSTIVRDQPATSPARPAGTTDRAVQVIVPDAAPGRMPFHAAPSAAESSSGTATADKGKSSQRGALSAAATAAAGLSSPPSMSVEQARSYQAALRAAAAGSEAPLMTSAQRERAAREKRELRRPAACRVKFRFPDGVTVSGSFDPAEPASALHLFCTQLLDPACLANAGTGAGAGDACFELRLPGASDSLPSSSTPKSTSTVGSSSTGAAGGSGSGAIIPNDPTKELFAHLDLGAATLLQVVPSPRDRPLRVKASYTRTGVDASAHLAGAASGAASLPGAAPGQQQQGVAGEGRGREDDRAQKGDGMAEKLAKKTPKWLMKTLGKKS